VRCHELKKLEIKREIAQTTASRDSSENADRKFLSDVRSFLDHSLTSDLRKAGRATTGVHSDIAACRIWHRRLYDRGWIAPAWPKDFGGAGWNTRQRYLFDRECAANDAPVLFASGLRALGPLLIEQGSDEQREYYLPRILSGEDLWCQGFSEPGAGSDLSALRCRAERDGDDYVVTGSKIWTTGAHLANRMFAIVRTARTERQQHGLTFLLIDMASHGLSVMPIRDLAGGHELNEVFFEKVRVPARDRVGSEHEGWVVARRLMQLARSNNTPAALVRRELRRAAETISAFSPDRELLVRLAELEIQVNAFEQYELAVIGQGITRAAIEMTPSTLKLVGSELRQRISELALAAMGPVTQAAGQNTIGEAAARDSQVVESYLSHRAATIYSGTSEIQRNQIARGLVDFQLSSI
jgi:acyl-CoA dehydrogenase